MHAGESWREALQQSAGMLLTVASDVQFGDLICDMFISASAHACARETARLMIHGNNLALLFLVQHRVSYQI